LPVEIRFRPGGRRSRARRVSDECSNEVLPPACNLIAVLSRVLRQLLTVGLLVAIGALLAGIVRLPASGRATASVAGPAEGGNRPTRSKAFLGRLIRFSRRVFAIGIFVVFGALAAKDTAEAALPALPPQVVHQQVVAPAWHETATSQRPTRPSPELLVQRVAATFPEDADRAVRILDCESSDGRDALTYDTTLDNGGPLQLNRWWESYFAESNGWTWDDLVNNLDVHLQAARFVYDDAKTWSASGWSPWECYTSGAAR